MERSRSWAPGFRGSANTGCEVVFYSRDNDPIVTSSKRGGAFKTAGRRNYSDEPVLMNVSTTKKLGQASGQFTIELGYAGNLFDVLTDDDWVDITFTKDGQSFHVMRGLIDQITSQTSVTGSGVTTRSWTVSGRDHGKIFDVTPVYYDTFAGENFSGAATVQAATGHTFNSILDGIPNDGFGVGAATAVTGNPARATYGFLFGFIRQFNDRGRSLFLMPPGIPGVGQTDGDVAAADTIKFDNLYVDDPKRIGIGFNFMEPQGTLWSLATEWSDPMFNELIVDLYPAGASLDRLEQGLPSHPAEALLRVTLRERPLLNGGGDAGNSPFLRLPTFEVPRQACQSVSISRTGDERYNAFFVTPTIAPEYARANQVDLMRPLVDEASIARHGLRRFDADSRYQPNGLDSFTYLSNLREKVRNWYAINPYLYAGTIVLNVGIPDARVGTRLRVNGPDESSNFTGYIEGIAHQWDEQNGTRTKVSLTRGYVGTDQDLVDLQNDVTSRYRIPEEAIGSTYASGG